MKKRNKAYIIVCSIVLLSLFVFALVKSNSSSSQNFQFPVDASKAPHYELKEKTNVDKLNFTIEGLESMNKGKWRIVGDFDDAMLRNINDNFTFMFSKDDTIIQKSMSNVENLKTVVMIYEEEGTFDQLALIDNRSGEVMIVVNLK